MASKQQVSERPLLVLYGSQTGTAQGFAKALSNFGHARGFNTRIHALDDFDFAKLPEEQTVVFTTCTFYNGEFPDNAAKFWQKLSDKKLPRDYLAKLQFAVFGLGNRTNKDNFNVAAKRLTERLSELGGKLLLPTGLGDEYDENGHETVFRPFMAELWAKLGATEVAHGLSAFFKISPGCKDNKSGKVETDLKSRLPADFIEVPVKDNVLLTAKGYDRPVNLIGFDLSKTHATYELADHIQVFPTNEEALVQRVAKALHLALDEIVHIETTNGAASPFPCCASIHRLLKSFLDLSAAPSRSMLDMLSLVAKDKAEKAKLETLAGDMFAGNEYSRRTSGDVLTLADVLEEFKSISLTLTDLLSHIPLLQPRYYSVCSAPSHSPKTLEIAYLVNTYEGKVTKKRFNGVCSTYLAQLKPGDLAHIKIQRGLLRPPKPDVPTVCIGLGTGVAVFRGVLQHNEQLLKQKQNVGRMRLYFGMRHADKDFIFKDEFAAFEKAGLVELIPSASHDQKEFITPSNKISKEPHKVWEILSNGGSYLYCGLGGLIPGWIEESVEKAIEHSGELADLAAVQYISSMKKNGRWQVEAYSVSEDEDNALKDIAIRKAGHLEAKDIPLVEQFKNAHMLCFQCEQTFQGRGCTSVGVCGKSPEVAALQDLLIHEIKRLSWFAHEYRQLPGHVEQQVINEFTLFGTFSTLTNVNFDEERFVEFLDEAAKHTATLETLYTEACAKANVKPKKCPLPPQDKAKSHDVEDLVSKGKDVGILTRLRTNKNDALVGLQEMLVYGLKGVSAYADHAGMFGYHNAEVYSFIHEAFAFLLSPAAKQAEKVLEMLMRCGTTNITALKMLHEANTTYGAQSPVEVKIKPTPGKAILVSGHDMKMLHELLTQTEGKGINIYTHGEMLPAHGYPKLREFKHLAGHFGVAWQRQSVEFPAFPGAILMTTNCITPPKPSYAANIFTTGAVGFKGIKHINGLDYSAVIAKALEMPGFSENDKEFSYPIAQSHAKVPSFTVGFGHEVVLSVADKVIEAVKTGLVSRFYVIGGCDGYEGERSYFTDLCKILPETSVVLTCGCGKYRVNQCEFGTIGNSGIPRLLDLGQCNDSYSAVVIALALADAFKCGVNDLPLSIVLSWFEQKAVAVLLSLLSLGVQNIRLGPALPAFIRPSVLPILVEKFKLKPVQDPAQDLKHMLAGDK